jgi:hypothetical protein
LDIAMLEPAPRNGKRRGRRGSVLLVRVIAVGAVAAGLLAATEVGAQATPDRSAHSESTVAVQAAGSALHSNMFDPH